MVDYSLTWTQKLLSLGAVFLLSMLVWVIGPLQTTTSTILYLLNFGLVFLVTFFVSAGWSFKAVFQEKSLMVRSNRGQVQVPYDKVGLLVRSGSKFFPTLIVVLRAAEVGQTISSAKLDPESRRLIDEYKSRMPNKELTLVQVPGRYIRSIKGFAEELQRRVPPVKIDPRIS
ncbi:MAG TPA: hypothetical protein VK191_07675 [Symbiobacteriaceae bacterium]|nr:hypothetical protein [Symbiobacteriaceae bacterium]